MMKEPDNKTTNVNYKKLKDKRLKPGFEWAIDTVENQSRISYGH